MLLIVIACSHQAVHGDFSRSPTHQCGSHEREVRQVNVASFVDLVAFPQHRRQAKGKQKLPLNFF